MSSEQALSLPLLLDQRAAADPDKIALRIERQTLTYAELRQAATRLAAGFERLGIARGDHVCVMLETSCDYVSIWLGLNWLGAVEVPINSGFRGAALAHALTLTPATTLIIDECYLDRFREIDTEISSISRVVVRGGDGSGPIDGREWIDFKTVNDSVSAPPPMARPSSTDTALILFTSGSTGPSKACCIPHGYVIGQPAIFCRELGITAADTLYAPFPLFHADGAIFTVAAAFSAGATAALAKRFSVSGFWADCRRHGATVIDYMGATLTMLFRQPRSDMDRDHQVRLGWGVPAPPFATEFEDRFGFPLVEVYGLSDAGIVLYNRPGEPRRAGSCGRVVPPFDVQIHGPDGKHVADGEVGEIVIRSEQRDLITTGYFGDPQATREAFRGEWFRTGDLGRRDNDGYFYFVGRLKDIIRRRGENISAFDIEQALLSHPDVVDAAAYGVPSDLTEEDVMAAVVLRADAPSEASDIREWIGARAARHLVPRYIRIAASLPRTPTEKVAKHILIQQGVTPDTLDFQQASPSQDTPNAA